MAQEICAVHCVSPIGEGDADLLEQPARIGSVSVGHEDGGLDGLIQRQEFLGEDLAVGGFEVGFGVFHAL